MFTLQCVMFVPCYVYMSECDSVKVTQSNSVKATSVTTIVPLSTSTC